MTTEPNPIDLEAIKAEVNKAWKDRTLLKVAALVILVAAGIGLLGT